MLSRPIPFGFFHAFYTTQILQNSFVPKSPRVDQTVVLIHFGGYILVTYYLAFIPGVTAGGLEGEPKSKRGWKIRPNERILTNEYSFES